MKIRKLLFVFLSITILFACKKDEELIDDIPREFGKVNMSFFHTVAGEDVIFDSLIYINEAGNKYQVDEIMYFITDLEFVRDDSKVFTLSYDKSVHYIDIDVPESLNWKIEDNIPIGKYDSLRFVFGLDENRNKTFAFLNPPESSMFWPDVLGGGYHYLKLNGKWENLENNIVPFNFHLGIGQFYSGDEFIIDSITDFVHNHFTVSVPLSNFVVEKDKQTDLNLEMQLENWFRNPHIWDHNYWGGSIMQNQAAIRQACENGHDVFKQK